MANFISMSIKDVELCCLQLYEVIKKEKYIPDAIVYLESGGWLIGYRLSKKFNVPCYGVKVSRSLTSSKKRLASFSKILPDKVKYILRWFITKSCTCTCHESMLAVSSRTRHAKRWIFLYPYPPRFISLILLFVPSIFPMHTYLKISSTTCGEEPLRFIEIKIGFHKKNNKRYIEKLPDLSVFNNILIVDDALDTGYSIKSLIERIGNYNEKNIKIAVINHSDTRSIIKPHYHIYSNKIVQFPWSTDSKFYNQYFSFKKAILDMETKEVYEK